MCISHDETVEMILGKFLAGTLGLVVHLRPGQKLICAALHGMIINDLIDFDLRSQSFLLRHDMLGFIRNNHGGYVIFSKDSCKNRSLRDAAAQFPKGLVSQHFYTNLLLHIIGLNSADFAVNNVDPQLLKEIVRILQHDSFEPQQVRKVGGVSATDIATAKAEARLSGNFSVTGSTLPPRTQVTVGDIERILQLGSTARQSTLQKEFCQRFSQQVRNGINYSVAYDLLLEEWFHLYDYPTYAEALGDQTELKETEKYHDRMNDFMAKGYEGLFSNSLQRSLASRKRKRHSTSLWVPSISR